MLKPPFGVLAEYDILAYPKVWAESIAQFWDEPVKNPVELVDAVIICLAEPMFWKGIGGVPSKLARGSTGCASLGLNILSEHEIWYPATLSIP